MFPHQPFMQLPAVLTRAPEPPRPGYWPDEPSSTILTGGNTQMQEATNLILYGPPGTGKTYTIVEKIKHIIEKEIYNPEKIVCLTFSNEAAASMKSRILKGINSEKEPIVKTFHSFCADLLRKHGEKIGISQNFRILLPDDSKILMHKNFKLQGYYCHLYINAIGTAKDLGIKIEDHPLTPVLL
jgi:superfamily I DNA/RNA helicase